MVRYVVECSSDEMLLLALGATRKQVIHEANRDEVVKYVLKKPPGECLGMIDEDPTTLHGRQRRQFQEGLVTHDLCIATFQGRVLVVLKPILEGWLIKAVRASGGKMTDIDKGLSDDISELHKRLSPRGDARLRKVIAFLDAKGSPHLHTLKKTLSLG
jgi:hypothetical protein